MPITAIVFQRVCGTGAREGEGEGELSCLWSKIMCMYPPDSDVEIWSREEGGITVQG